MIKRLYQNKSGLHIRIGSGSQAGQLNPLVQHTYHPTFTHKYIILSFKFSLSFQSQIVLMIRLVTLYGSQLLAGLRNGELVRTCLVQLKFVTKIPASAGTDRNKETTNQNSLFRSCDWLSANLGHWPEYFLPRSIPFRPCHIDGRFRVVQSVDGCYPAPS
eukprot:sb/3472878/